jgi:hypothetical protein
MNRIVIMSQLECNGIILIDYKLKRILFENNKGNYSFPKKSNYFD